MVINVFLIDDDVDDRALFCDAILQINKRIIVNTAEDVELAMSKLLNKKIKIPDIIFLDINMPCKDGWNCLSRLKSDQLYRDIPVIMYSTSSSVSDIKKAQQFGALCLFTKPDNFDDLKNSLQIIIDLLKTNSLSSIPAKASPWLVCYTNL
jgi:CheY-like chemotaxis protein